MMKLVKISETALKLMTFFYAVLILFGNVYVFFYYDSFKINIYDYMSLSEIPAIFLPYTLRILVLLSFIFLLFLLLADSLIRRYEKKIKSIKSNFGKLRFIHQKRIHVFIVSAIVFYLLAFLADSLNALVVTKHLGYKYLLVFSKDVFESIGGLVILVGMVWAFSRRVISKITAKYFIAIVAMAFSLKLIITLATMDAYWLRFTHPSNNKTYLFAKSDNKTDTLITNEITKYIGRTSSDIFFYKRYLNNEQVFIFKKDKLISPELNSFSDMAYPLPINK